MLLIESVDQKFMNSKLPNKMEDLLLFNRNKLFQGGDYIHQTT